jgi:hypothetical protein
MDLTWRCPAHLGADVEGLDAYRARVGRRDSAE